MITSKDIFRFVMMTFVIVFSLVLVVLLVAALSWATIARTGGITLVAGGVSEILLLAFLIGLVLAPMVAYLIVSRRKVK